MPHVNTNMVDRWGGQTGRQDYISKGVNEKLESILQIERKFDVKSSKTFIL